jgi:SSS family solute:Na+ symporter
MELGSNMIDLLIVVVYFLLVMMTAISGGQKKELTSEEYFLSSRSLRWPSIAFSTIATNIGGYQFLGMMGSAYLYGLAQASLEINAVQGILLASFIFIPYYLKDKIITITQFIKARLGRNVALLYSLANILLFSTIIIGAALFWGAYAADVVFEEYLSILHEDRLTRITILILLLGLFSAAYTYLGGLSAVVRTDIIQFLVLLTGGMVMLLIAVHHLGGWSQLYIKTPKLMHLHLPSDHEKLPWTHIFGLFLLNINYWCANQSIVQRSLAAKNIRHAQIGLMVGGLMKYIIAVIIIVPGIALFGILGENGLSDPDMSFPYLVNTYLPIGAKGLVLCGLFASIMSTVDSTFNSVATLWSIDIYKEYLNNEASDRQIVRAGRRAILFSFFTGVTVGVLLLYLKFSDPNAAFTHTLNELRYFINCGIVVIICAAIFLVDPNHKVTLATFLSTIVFQFIFKSFFPEMNYFVRAMWIILLGFILIYLLSKTNFKNPLELFKSGSKKISRIGLLMLLSLVILHIIFH